MYDQNYSHVLSETLQESEKHKVFISFHHEDQLYRDKFDSLYGNYFISKSVETGNIDPDNSDEYIKRLIQDEHISDSSVVVALYGANTWKRKHVDWEVYAALDKKVGGYSGLMVMVLPNFPVDPFDSFRRYDERQLYPYFHPRTATNINSGFASVYYWPGMYPSLPTVQITDAFKLAFDKRVTHKQLIDNSHPQFQNNR